MKTVRARLLGVMLLIVIPVAAGIVLIAYSGYAAEERDVREVQATAANGRAQVMRAWLDTVGGALSDQAAAAAFLGAGPCAELARSFLRRNADYAAVRFVDASGKACAAGQSIDLSQLPANASGSKPNADFRLAVVDDRLWIATAGAAATSGPEPSGVLVLKADALSSRLEALDTLGETHLALIANDTTLVSQSAPGDSSAWLPQPMPSAAEGRSWVGRDPNGRLGAFVLTPPFGPHLSILVQFDDRRLVEAWRRLVAICLAPLALLALLSFAYAISIQRDVVRWIKGIEAAARKRSGDPNSSASAPVNAGMPDELRSVAHAFNAMAEHVTQRQVALQTSLAENRALMQEMHHRVKNSLQVIQSYVALIRRMERRADSVALTRISGSVSVLSVAYRMALTPGGMRPVPVKPFLEEVASALFASLRRPYQTATADIEWEGELDVDRAIPLGLGMVEAIIAGIEAAKTTTVAVRLFPTDEGRIELIVKADVAPVDDQPPDKILIGLAGQLGATDARATDDILAWRFTP